MASVVATGAVAAAAVLPPVAPFPVLAVAVGDVVGYLAAVGLAAVFAAAAVAKLADRPGTARGFRALGLPAPYTLGLLVPAVEAALTALLLVVPLVGAGTAVILLAAFSALIAGRLAQGVHAPCACFGGSGGPLSWRHLVRNGALLVVAGAVLVLWRGSRPQVPAIAAGVVTVTAVAAASRHGANRQRPGGAASREP